MKELCGHCKKFASGKIATWYYMPSTEYADESPFYCDDCVPRGCECQIKRTFAEHDEQRFYVEFDEMMEAFKDGKPHPLMDRHCKDDEGKLLPCIEFEYNEFGFEEGTDGVDIIEEEFRKARKEGRVLYENTNDEGDDE
jgi:hypothetical protein